MFWMLDFGGLVSLETTKIIFHFFLNISFLVYVSTNVYAQSFYHLRVIFLYHLCVVFLHLCVVLLPTLIEGIFQLNLIFPSIYSQNSNSLINFFIPNLACLLREATTLTMGLFLTKLEFPINLSPKLNSPPHIFIPNLVCLLREATNFAHHWVWVVVFV